jgi:hypothetical protein
MDKKWQLIGDEKQFLIQFSIQSTLHLHISKGEPPAFPLSEYYVSAVQV